MTSLSAFVACATLLVGAQGSSVQSWDNLKIVMDGSADKEVDAVYLYGITVTSGGEKWTTYHRYNDFAALKKFLGTEADVIAAAPFPGKYFWFWPSAAMKDDRRKGLEKWLQEVAVRAAKVIDSWKEPLNEFLKKDSEIGKYGRDPWMQFVELVKAKVEVGWATTKDRLMQLASSVDDTAQSSWAATASKLQEWYDNGVAQCEGAESCKALSARLANMKSGVAEMAQTMVSKTEELKERIKEALALSKEADQADADLKKVKDSAGNNPEEVKAAEEKLAKAKEEVSKKIEEVEQLKEDVQDLEKSANAAMENSFENTVASLEL
jgi:hypothetical protein